MKVLIVSQIYTPQHEGGAERVARRTAQDLRAKGHEVHVLAAADPMDGPPSDMTTDIPVHRVLYRNRPMPGVGPMQMGAFKKLKWHIKNAMGGMRASDLKATIRTIAPYVIYAHNSTLFQPQLGRIAHEAKIPVVQHLHDYGWMCPRNSMFKAGQNCDAPCASCNYLTQKWRKAARPSIVISVSDFVRDRYKTHGVFPNADWQVLRNTQTPVSAPNRKANSKFTFGFIGALVPDKGISDLVSAFCALDDAQTRLVIAGTGDDAFVAEMRAQAQGHDVTWLGHVDKDQFYEQVDCVVVPSRWHEPQSLVLGEAMSRDLPLLVSKRGGSTEVVTLAKGGLVFDPDDAGSLVNQLSELRNSRPEDFEFAMQGVLPTTGEFADRVEQLLIKAAGS